MPALFTWLLRENDNLISLDTLNGNILYKHDMHMIIGNVRFSRNLPFPGDQRKTGMPQLRSFVTLGSGARSEAERLSEITLIAFNPPARAYP